MTSSSNFSSLYTSTVQSGPLLLMQHFHPNLAFKFFIPLPPILHLLPLLSHYRPLLLAVSLHLLLSLPLLTLLGFFNGMLVVYEQGALNCYTTFRLIPLTLFVFRNLILTHLSLSGSLGSLLFNLIAPTPGLAFSLMVTPRLAAALSFSSGRAYLSLNFLPSIFLCLTPTLIM